MGGAWVPPNNAGEPTGVKIGKSFPPFLKGGMGDFDIRLENPPKSPFRKGGL